MPARAPRRADSPPRTDQVTARLREFAGISLHPHRTAAAPNRRPPRPVLPISPAPALQGAHFSHRRSPRHLLNSESLCAGPTAVSSRSASPRRSVANPHPPGCPNGSSPTLRLRRIRGRGPCLPPRRRGRIWTPPRLPPDLTCLRSGWGRADGRRRRCRPCRRRPRRRRAAKSTARR